MSNERQEVYELEEVTVAALETTIVAAATGEEEADLEIKENDRVSERRGGRRHVASMILSSAPTASLLPPLFRSSFPLYCGEEKIQSKT